MKQLIDLKEPAGAVTAPSQVFEHIRSIDIDFSQENFLVFTFNTRQQIINIDVIFKGGLDGTIIDPRTLFRKILFDNAAGFLIAHNHPSGHLDPSHEDIAATNTIQEAAKLLQITFCDHIIFNSGEYYSLKNGDHL